jgi:archaellum component FlaC
MGSDSKIGTLFWRLLQNYYHFGWPFLLLHIVVLILSVWAWWGLFKEIRHLRSWNPGARSGGSQATQILDQFIAESRELGSQGFLVPITDFSDRLDSIVGGKVTELYERINLFLIVGIAGTLFGVFSFASDAAGLLGDQALSSSDRVVRLGETLSSSLANAFPVGFVGLALMFLGQVGVSVWENRLKRTVAEATSKALEQRIDGVRSQAQIVGDAAARIERAMEPLSNVHDLLERTFGPVMEKLEARLSLSLGHVTQQIEHLEGTTAGFSSAVADLRGGVTDLGRSTGHLESLLEQVPEVLERLMELEKGQEKALQEFQASLERSLDVSGRTILALEGSIQATQELPAQILRETQAALEMVSREVSEVSAAMVGELKKQMVDDSDLLFRKLEEQIRSLQESLLITSDNLRKHLAASADTLFNGLRGQAEALEELVQTLGSDLRSNLEAGRQTIAALEKVTQASQELPSLILEVTKTALAALSDQTSSTTGAMVETLRQQLAADYGELFRQVAERISELRESLTTSGEQLSRHLVSSADALLAGIQGPVETVQALISQTGTELRETSKASQEAAGAIRGLREEAKASMDATFTTVGQESRQTWETMTGRFGAQTQTEFGNFLLTIQESTGEIRSATREAAQNWNHLATNAETLVRDPIVEALHKVGEELQKGVRGLDSLMAQRYPDVVRDVGAFTSGLQGLLVQVESVQKALDRWSASVDYNQQQTETAHQEFLDKLSSSVPAAGRSPEMEALVQETLTQQLSPVQTKLDQIDARLQELREQKASMAWLRSIWKKSAEPKPVTPLKAASEETGAPDSIVPEEASRRSSLTGWRSWFRRERR